MQLVHRFAASHHFKGPHNAYGKDAKLLCRTPTRHIYVHMVLVLAPNAAGGGGVYGVDRDEGGAGMFTASPPPPFQMADQVVSASVPIKTADLPPRTVRKVPVWGVLYTCNETNLMSDYNTLAPMPSPAACAAVATMRRHRTVYEPLYSRLHAAALPGHLALSLAPYEELGAPPRLG